MPTDSKPKTRLSNRGELFWEIRADHIERALVENDDWVIVRVFQYGDIEDIFDVIRLYGKAKVKSVLSAEKLRPMAAAMAYLFLNVDRYRKHGS